MLKTLFAPQRDQRDAQTNCSQDTEQTVPATALPNRRRFLKKIGGAAAGMWAAQALAVSAVSSAEPAQAQEPEPSSRATRAFFLRANAAFQDRSAGYPPHPTNGDEQRYPQPDWKFFQGLAP